MQVDRCSAKRKFEIQEFCLVSQKTHSAQNHSYVTLNFSMVDDQRLNFLKMNLVVKMDDRKMNLVLKLDDSMMDAKIYLKIFLRNR